MTSESVPSALPGDQRDSLAEEDGALARNPAQRPSIRLKPKAQRRVLNGYPWIFANEIEVTAESKGLRPGILARLEAHDGQPLGVIIFNRLPLICGRMLSPCARDIIDEGFFFGLLQRALSLRERCFSLPYYRLIHAEADGIPGVIIDRYGDAIVIQVNTAGMDRLTPLLAAALERLLSPSVIVLRNDAQARFQEGLDLYQLVIKGKVEGLTQVIENGATFFADLREGQKTGWFYDQRDNRRLAACFAKDRDVLDCYSFSGGFAVQSALAGATSALCLDRSEQALLLAQKAAEANGVANRCRFLRNDVFKQLESFAREGRRFGLVIVDPPAFVKTRKDLPQGSKGYRKLARLAARLVEENGILVAASCSHHMPESLFHQQIAKGLFDSNRTARILYNRGAGPDHPLHANLPESQYLKLGVYAMNQ